MLPHEIDQLLKTIPRDQIVGLECKHVTYCPSQYGNPTDLLVSKEIVHLKDGRKLPRLRFRKDYKRPFWITKKAYQTYRDKKEGEDLRKLEKFETLQCRLTESIIRAQGYGNPKASLKMLARSSYLWGCDISTPTLFKAEYMTHYPGLFTPNQVAVMDSETDVVNGDGEVPILLSVTFRDKAFMGINSNWLADTPENRAQIHAMLDKHVGDVIKARNTTVELYFSDNPAEVCYQVFQKCHEWQPDFVAFWNIDYDMPRIIRCLERGGYDLAQVFSDPRVPPEFQYFQYIPGLKTKEKADGTIENLPPADRWHVVRCPASFFFIDAMCVYRRIRLAAGKESYALDAILTKFLKRGKLYFNLPDLGSEGDLPWHFAMQRDHKIEYVVYNYWDDVGIELLDEITLDLQTQISILSQYSEYSVFHSGPKRTMNEMHFLCLEYNKAVASLSDRMEDELDTLLLGKDDWIVTLPSHQVVDNGIPLIKELPNVRSTVRLYTSDADITSTYPNGEIIMNVSKETTMMELARIKGITAASQRMIGVNLTAGPSNAIEILTEIAGAPTPEQLLTAFREHLAERDATRAA